MNAPGYYESERALSEYLLFHYGTAAEVLPWPFGPAAALDYPARCVSECLDPSRLPVNARALDLGCAVGRASFELARHCPEVIGIDASRRFVGVAQQLQQSGALTYAYVEEGVCTKTATARVPEGVDRARVRFEQGDALALRRGLGTFDVVLLANLLDRLPAPRRFLEALPGLVKPGGQAIITTPCTWLEEYTPRQEWLGGFVENGRAVPTLETLQRILSPTFHFARQLDLPFLLREHARKYQWSVALATIWICR